MQSKQKEDWDFDEEKYLKAIRTAQELRVLCRELAKEDGGKPGCWNKGERKCIFQALGCVEEGIACMKLSAKKVKLQAETTQLKQEEQR